MSDDGGNDSGAKEPPGALGKALATLLEGVTNQWVRAVLAVLVVVAIVVVFAFAGSIAAFVLFILVALVVIGFVGWIARETNRVAGGTVVDMNDTVAVASALAEQSRQDISRALAEAAAEAAGVLGVPADAVRANLFGVSTNSKLSILQGLTHQIDRADELALTLDVGEGSTGVAFGSGRPNIAVLRTDWGSASIPGSLLSKVHPELRWIVSVPVFADATRRPMWILNVDGLREPADINGLQAVVGRLVFYAQAIALIVAKATSKE